MKQIVGANLAVVLILAIGCGQGETQPRLPTVKATGKLYLDDKPYGGCTVLFAPQVGLPSKDKPQPKSASASVAADGSFTLTTYDQDDGIIPGNKYQVTIAPELPKVAAKDGSPPPMDMSKPMPVTKPLLVDVEKPADGKPLVLEIKLEGTGESTGIGLGGPMPGGPGAVPGGAPGGP